MSYLSILTLEHSLRSRQKRRADLDSTSPEMVLASLTSIDFGDISFVMKVGEASYVNLKNLMGEIRYLKPVT